MSTSTKQNPTWNNLGLELDSCTIDLLLFSNRSRYLNYNYTDPRMSEYLVPLRPTSGQIKALRPQFIADTMRSLYNLNPKFQAVEQSPMHTCMLFAVD